MKLLVWCLSLLILSTGCQKTIVKEVSPANVQAEGTIDSGGGNAIDGRPIDSYAFDPFLREEIKDSIVPLINELSKVNIKFAAAMLNLLREKTWFLVPVELDKIPAKNIGVSFPNDQMALQTRREIYIDSRQFNPADISDRTTLMMHELLMGMRIYRFNNSRYHCIAKATVKLLDGSKADDFKKARDKCIRENPNSGKDDLLNKISLNTDDYELIRGLTAKFMMKSDNISEAELDSWLIDARLMDPTESRYFNADGSPNELGLSALPDYVKPTDKLD